MDIYRTALTFLKGNGQETIKKLIAHYGDEESLFKEKKKALEKIPSLKPAFIKSITSKEIFLRAEKEIEFMLKNDIQQIYFKDKNYPQRLLRCSDYPIILFYKGNADLNAIRVLSIVGTRRLTRYGSEITQRIVEELSQYGILICSGLASGIDGIAHKTAIENNTYTIGVLGHGLDKMYPSEHRKLASIMIEKGGLLTEFHSNHIINPINFPKRNRIIAGMADATIVTEAAKRGGALITANLAASYDRDVFAIPGRIGDKKSEGCNLLIRNNKAALVLSAEDILWNMNWEISTNQQLSFSFPDLSEVQTKIFNFIKENGEPHIDEIGVLTEIESAELASELLQMELLNVVISLAGKKYKIRQ